MQKKNKKKNKKKFQTLFMEDVKFWRSLHEWSTKNWHGQEWKTEGRGQREEDKDRTKKRTKQPPNIFTA
ncbi:MAG: hypothetical protein Q8847_02730 [Sweet potato little leaf phytoplasma]|nr:hypothetical protein [Sweet potato little leaf phytoplasma]